MNFSLKVFEAERWPEYQEDVSSAQQMTELPLITHQEDVMLDVFVCLLLTQPG